MKRKIRIKRCILAFALVSVMILTMTFNMSDSYGLSIITIPNNQAKTSESAVLKLNNSNYKATWKEGVKGKIVKKNSSDLICVPIGNKTKSWSIRDFLTLDFTNVGVLNGRNINAEVKYTKLSVSARQGSSSDEDPGGYIGIGAINSKYLVFGLTMTSGYGYRARKNVDYTVKITWADTGEVVNYPFFQSVIDIDAMADYYNEAWEAKSGYVMKYYKYAQNINSFSGNKVKAVSEEETTGDDRWFKTGIYAGTTGGIFSGTFDEGNCSTGLYLHSAYVTTPELFVNPVEKVNKNRVKVGEDFTYSVEHKMGVFYETQLTVYSKLIFTAPIPSDVDYISAKFLDGKGEDITGKGKLNYDSNRRVVTFEVGDEWRENAANYSGQVVSLKVDVKARDIKNQEEKTVLHKSSVKYEDGLEVDTNTVEVIIYQDINIQIVKRIRKADITTTKAHGVPTFLYKIDGKETWYKPLRFEYEVMDRLDQNESVEAEGFTFMGDGNYIVAKSEIMTLPYGKYTVTEKNTSRYVQVDKKEMWNDNVKIYFFENKKDKWNYCSDNDMVINSLVNKK